MDAMKPSATTGPPASRDAPGTWTTAARVHFLSQPAIYPERPAVVEVIETHFAWVFLAGGLAYKLKKPIGPGQLDLGTSEARRRSCHQEAELNQRLAASTYLGVEVLTVDANGQLALGGDGAAVDWLVKMVRLPASRMMDHLLRHDQVTDGDLTALMERLVRFHDEAPITDGTHFQVRIFRQLQQACRELHEVVDGMDKDLVSRATDRALRYMETQAGRIAGRVAAGRIRELHGDLRPEHICLLPDPQIIDCLEFDPSLRTLDCAQEMAFLAMECRALGNDAIGARLLGRYQDISADRVPDDLLHFYLGERALVRAMLAARHLSDPAVTAAGRWLPVTEKYLCIAADYLARIAEPPPPEPAGNR